MRIAFGLAVLLLGSHLAYARQDAPGGPVGYGIEALPRDELPDAQRRALRARLAQASRDLRAAGKMLGRQEAATVSFGWPLEAAPSLTDYGFHGISNFVDHNPAVQNLLQDYNCGTRTYDLAGGYNHQGTDIFTWPFAWKRMDEDQVIVVAIAPGIIIGKDDGNFDRNCGFNNETWNAVYVEHADGSVAWYGHLKNGSLTTRDVGETVAEGEFIGVVGSSGSSTAPHLHLELYDAGGNLLDPYAGPCNNIASRWAVQPPYYDSAVNAVMSHSTPPVFPACPQAEVTNADDVFQRGETVYLATYYRDQLQGQVSQYTLYRPDGGIYWQWTHSSPASHYAASYWYFWINLPFDAPFGSWQFEVVYEGKTYTHDFMVIDPLPVELTAFDAALDGRDVLLVWQTASETNNAGFEVQWRSNDGSAAASGAWQAVGFVEGHGTTAERQDYRYRVTGLRPGRHAFRLKQVDHDGTFAYGPEVVVGEAPPGRFALQPAYPNPFNPRVTIPFDVAAPARVEMSVYSVLGRRVALLVDRHYEPGRYEATWNAEDLPGGLYLCRLRAGGQVQFQSLMLVK